VQIHNAFLLGGLYQDISSNGGLRVENILAYIGFFVIYNKTAAFLFYNPEPLIDLQMNGHLLVSDGSLGNDCSLVYYRQALRSFFSCILQNLQNASSIH